MMRKSEDLSWTLREAICLFISEIDNNHVLSYRWYMIHTKTHNPAGRCILRICLEAIMEELNYELIALLLPSFSYI